MTIGIAVNTLFFFGMGVLALLRPAVLGRLVELSPETVLARNEVRAVYGGFGVVMALALLWSIGDAVLGPGVQLAVALALLGMAGGRVVSSVADGATARAAVFFVGEVLLALALIYL